MNSGKIKMSWLKIFSVIPWSFNYAFYFDFFSFFIPVMPWASFQITHAFAFFDPSLHWDDTECCSQTTGSRTASLFSPSLKYFPFEFLSFTSLLEFAWSTICTEIWGISNGKWDNLQSWHQFLGASVSLLLGLEPYLGTGKMQARWPLPQGAHSLNTVTKSKK